MTTRVVPRAGRSRIGGTRGDALLVRLVSPPVDGAANAELRAVIAEALGVPKRAVEIVSGERSRTKRVLVSGSTIAGLYSGTGATPTRLDQRLSPGLSEPALNASTLNDKFRGYT